MPSVTRLDLSCGSLDALHAVHFTQRFLRHFHDTYAIGVIESGATRVGTASGEWIARAGDILAFSPGEIHRADPVDVAGYCYRMVYPSQELVTSLETRRKGSGLERLRFPAPVIRDRQVALSLRNSQAALMDSGCSTRNESRLLGGLRGLLRHRSSSWRSADAPEADRLLISGVQQYLADHFATPVRLAAVAARFGVNLFQMLRLFRRMVGETPHAWLVQLRVNRAQAMLCQGEPVARVAYSCGFSDQSHLTRVFKRAVGVPPGQYRSAVSRQISCQLSAVS